MLTWAQQQPPRCSAPRCITVGNMLRVLDDDLVRRILEHLTGWEAARLCGVNRAWRAAIRSDAAFWRARFEADFCEATDVLRAGEVFQTLWAEQQRQLATLAADTLAPHFAPAAVQGLLQAVADRAPQGPSSCVPWPRELTLFARPLPVDAQDVGALRVRERWPEAGPRGTEQRGIGAFYDRFRKTLDTVAKPWVVHSLVGGHRQAGVPQRPHLENGGAGEHSLRVELPRRKDPTSWHALYACASQNARKSRCRVCNRSCTDSDRHPVLLVAMCACGNAPCQTLYPWVKLSAAKQQMSAQALALLSKLPKRFRLRRTYRKDKPRKVQLVLQSSVDACMRVTGWAAAPAQPQSKRAAGGVSGPDCGEPAPVALTQAMRSLAIAK